MYILYLCVLCGMSLSVSFCICMHAYLSLSVDISISLWVRIYICVCACVCRGRPARTETGLSALIYTDAVGKIIGRNGETLKHIRRTTDIRIDIPQRKQNTRTVTVCPFSLCIYRLFYLFLRVSLSLFSPRANSETITLLSLSRLPSEGDSLVSTVEETLDCPDYHDLPASLFLSLSCLCLAFPLYL